MSDSAGVCGGFVCCGKSGVAGASSELLRGFAGGNTIRYLWHVGAFCFGADDAGIRAAFYGGGVQRLRLSDSRGDSGIDDSSLYECHYARRASYDSGAGDEPVQDYALHCFPRGGLVTGGLLALARVSGETAPLLFTALFADAWPTGFFTRPTANVPVLINEYTMNSPFESMHDAGWGAALIICLFILLLNILTRTVFHENKH